MGPPQLTIKAAVSLRVRGTIRTMPRGGGSLARLKVLDTAAVPLLRT